MGTFTISMAIFNSYFDITRGYLDNDQQIPKFWWFPGFPVPSSARGHPQRLGQSAPMGGGEAFSGGPW